MKRLIKAISGDLKDFEVSVVFAGMGVGAETYEVAANSEDEAEELALEEALNDLEVISVDEVDEDEYEVEIGFAGQLGVSEIYTQDASDPDEAEMLALESASYDLDVEYINII